MTEQTLVFVKPEALRHWREIRFELKQLGTIAWQRMVTLNSDVIKNLYSFRRKEMLDATLQHLAGQQVATFVIEGEDIVRKVYTICGHSTDPRFCGPKTLRFRFAPTPHYIVVMQRVLYYYNAVHRSSHIVEAQQDIPLLQSAELVSPPL